MLTITLHSLPYVYLRDSTRDTPHERHEYWTDLILPQFFGVSGAGLSKIRNMQNGGKRPRHSVDQWDRQSM
jgi:hypothetical protein